MNSSIGYYVNFVLGSLDVYIALNENNNRPTAEECITIDDGTVWFCEACHSEIFGE